MEERIDERTRVYFSDIRSNLGHIGSNYSELGLAEMLDKKGYNISPEKIVTYPGYINSTDIDIYKYTIDDVTKFCAELAYQPGIDSFCVETHIFIKPPSREDVFLVRDLHKIEFDINFNGLNQEFCCWECGRHIHWLDTDGVFQEKVQHMRENFCGFCD